MLEMLKVRRLPDPGMDHSDYGSGKREGSARRLLAGAVQRGDIHVVHTSTTGLDFSRDLRRRDHYVGGGVVVGDGVVVGVGVDVVGVGVDVVGVGVDVVGVGVDVVGVGVDVVGVGVDVVGVGVVVGAGVVVFGFFL
jgi:hypothetical protein